MPNETETISVIRLSEEGRSRIEDVVVQETPLTIILNNQELVTLLSSPKDLNYLAVGFLASEGLLETRDDVKKIIIDSARGIARVETTQDLSNADDLVFKRLITTGCGRGASFYSAADVRDQEKIDSQVKVSAESISSLVREFQHRSELYRATGGVHSAALCDAEKILIFKEDIGRHNAVDKIFGECLLEDIPTEGKMIITSGRISSEILLKVARRKIPIIVSKSAPTNLGVKIAEDLGITLLGFARGKRVNIYTNDWRITAGGES